jgi:large subunit ribosomal protein L7/L12
MAMASNSFEKLIQDIGNMSVIELSDFVKAIEEKFGVTAAMPSAGAAAPAAAAVEAEKSEYKVTLKDAGTEKIKVIKAVKAVLPNVSLAEAKDKVEKVPSVIAEAVSKADAEKIKKELEAAGAKVELS